MSGFPSLVKGERLKIACICFVGSNPTPDTSLYQLSRQSARLLIQWSRVQVPDTAIRPTIGCRHSHIVQMVRIPGFHPGDPGSSPGMGILCSLSSVGQSASLMSSRSWVQAPQGARFRDVMVSISDFESDYPGSNPGETYLSSYPSLVKGERLKIVCIMLRGFKSHT